MKIKRIGEVLGAEVLGVDLRNPSDSEIDEIDSALIDHEVIFFRDAGLDDEQHMALAARFGTPSIFPINQLMGQTEPTFQTIVDGPASRPAADYWHTDVTWTQEPPRTAFLRATVIPETGGDTMWASMTTAYDALSPKVKHFFDELAVHHDNTYFIEGLIQKMGDAGCDLAERVRTEYPGVDHPLVRTHPETGRRALLYGGHFMRHIVGLEPAESQMVLDFLGRHVDQPHFQIRWKWRTGDLAIWDERSTVHRALGDHFPQHREMRRCVIDGERPF
jgi:taurine dioxygenase